MFQAYPLGRPFGVEVRLHSTLLWLVGGLVLSSLLFSGPLAALGTLGMLGALLVSVTLHELGHIGAARLFGIGTAGITLYPFGGLARLNREARSGVEEVVVALAGPAVNIFLAGLAAVPMVLLGPLEPLLTLLQVNVALAVFNLVPAYPMDGGRVLRGVLWPYLGQLRATRFAARAGQGFAILFAVLGLFWSPMLLVIGGFVFLQASAELRRTELQLAWGAPLEPPPPGVIRPQVLGPDGRPLGASGWSRPSPWASAPFGPHPWSGPLHQPTRVVLRVHRTR